MQHSSAGAIAPAEGLSAEAGADNIRPSAVQGERTMAEARIHQPARNTMQSGQGKTRHWVLEFDPAAPRTIDPLMGWTGSADTLQQLRLRFETREQAEAFAKRQGIAYRVEASRQRVRRIQNYADKFAWDRIA
jgi:hypothetical protein